MGSRVFSALPSVLSSRCQCSIRAVLARGGAGGDGSANVRGQRLDKLTKKRSVKAHRMMQRQHIQAFEGVFPLWLRHHAGRRRRSRPLVAVHCHGRSLSDWRAAPTRGHLRSPIRAPRCRGRARARTVRCRALARRRGARGSAAEAIERESSKPRDADDSPVPPNAGHSAITPIAYQERRFIAA